MPMHAYFGNHTMRRRPTGQQFNGHDYDMRHYVTPRTCPDFYVDRRSPVDRMVFKASCIIGILLLVAMLCGIV